MKTTIKFSLHHKGTNTLISKHKVSFIGDVEWQSVRALLKKGLGYNDTTIRLISRTTSGGESTSPRMIVNEKQEIENIELRGRVNTLTARCHELTADLKQEKEMVAALSKQISDMNLQIQELKKPAAPSDDLATAEKQLAEARAAKQKLKR